MLSIPVAGLAQTFVDADARLVAEVVPSFVDSKSSDLPKPIDASREDRRRNAKRFAELLANVAGNDQRPDWIVMDTHVYVDGTTYAFDELLDCEVLVIANQIRLARASAGFRGQ